jgi:hypothetical protein
MRAVPGQQEVYQVHRRVRDVERVERRGPRNPSLSDKLITDEFYVLGGPENSHAVEAAKSQCALGFVAEGGFLQNDFRRHELVAVPVAIPPRPCDGLLFREPVVLGNPGDEERRNRGYEVDAWHRPVGEWAAGSNGKACTCVPYRVKPPRAGPTLSLGVVFCPPWLLSPLSPASWPPLPRERLKPHAIDIRVNIDPVHWFLSPPRDTRSSLYLEDAATEFQVQGLRSGTSLAF